MTVYKRYIDFGMGNIHKLSAFVYKRVLVGLSVNFKKH